MSHEDPTGDEMMRQDEAQYLQERDQFFAGVESLRNSFPDLFASYFGPHEGGAVEALRSFFVLRGNGAPRLPVGRAISTIKGLDEDYAALRKRCEKAERLLLDPEQLHALADWMVSHGSMDSNSLMLTTQLLHQRADDIAAFRKSPVEMSERQRAMAEAETDETEPTILNLREALKRSVAKARPQEL